MNFKQKISAFNLGFLTDRDMPEIALTGLEEGYDSESLIILAGLTPNDNYFRMLEYFKEALSELGLEQKDKLRSLIDVAYYYASQIITGKEDPYTGFDTLNRLVRQTDFDYPDMALDFCYADYITLWEVIGDGLQMQAGSGLTKDEFIVKTKSDLRLHLKEWSLQMDDKNFSVK
jgi:hypothetical protein